MSIVEVNATKAVFGWPLYATWNALAFARVQPGRMEKTLSLLSFLPVLLFTTTVCSALWAAIIWSAADDRVAAGILKARPQDLILAHPSRTSSRRVPPLSLEELATGPREARPDDKLRKRLEGWRQRDLRPSFETPRKSAAPPAITAKPLRGDEDGACCAGDGVDCAAAPIS